MTTEKEDPILRLVFLALICGLITTQAVARTLRNPTQRAMFVRHHPCPGYVVDHIEPLCAGGPDDPGNMQWQTVKEAKEKDRKEREMCRRELR